MARRGRKYAEVREKVDKTHLLGIDEALGLVKESSFAGFDETVEVAARLGVDPRHADQIVRGTVVLPHGTGKEMRILVFAKGEQAKEAEEAGADFVGAEDLAEKIQGGWLEFDVAIAAPDVMNVVGKLGRVLGPRGLMPNPKAGTVTPEIGEAVNQFKAGKIEYRTDRAGVIHAPIGKVSFELEALRENFMTLMDALVKARPAAAKGQYIRGLSVSSTMGPGIKINPQEVLNALR